METLNLEEENIKIINLLKLEKERNGTAIKDIRNLFRLEKQNKATKYRIQRDIRNRFEHEEEGNYHKPVIVDNFSSNNYIEYKSKGD